MNHRVEALTFFRFIAAIIVVIFHYGRKATGFDGVLASGPQMVTFFFVLSGFVMVLSYYNKGKIGVLSYWWARLSRIMPVYIFAIVLMVLYIHHENGKINATSLVLNLLLLQSWFPPHPLSINSPGWSLSVEMFFYLTFPVTLGLIKKYNLSAMKIAFAALVLWGGTQAVLAYFLSDHTPYGAQSLTHELVHYFPLSHYCSFLMGISGGVWFVTNGFRVRGYYQSIAIVGIAVLLVVSALNHQPQISDYLGFLPAFGSSFFAPLFLVFIMSIALCRTRVIEAFSVKPLVLLGEASYSLYILQEPVHQFYSRYFASDGATAQWNFYIYLASLTVISVLSFLMFEKPANKFLRRNYSGAAAFLLPSCKGEDRDGGSKAGQEDTLR